jgi:hypothetical protein
MAAAVLAVAFGAHTVAGSPVPRAGFSPLRWPAPLELPLPPGSDGFLSRRAVARLQAASWHGGPVQASTGETVTVYVSDSYGSDPAVQQRWADYFASLLHGSELSLLSAYVVTPGEVASLCDNANALGCYSYDRLVIAGETVDGIAPEAVAAHEYGHHIAANRSNQPWQAIDWGTKRWASAEEVCARARDGTAAPGDEGDRYAVNPGEAFAESYRVLSASRIAAATAPWSIVDPGFYPDAAALQAVAEDVLEPYSPPAPRTVRGAFAARGTRTWTLPLTLPLDGQLSIVLRMPKEALYGLSLLAPGGSATMARGLWSGVAEKTVGYKVCGDRSLLIRVTERGPAGRFTLRISQP